MLLRFRILYWSIEKGLHFLGFLSLFSSFLQYFIEGGVERGGREFYEDSRRALQISRYLVSVYIKQVQSAMFNVFANSNVRVRSMTLNDDRDYLDRLGHVQKQKKSVLVLPCSVLATSPTAVT